MDGMVEISIGLIFVDGRKEIDDDGEDVGNATDFMLVGIDEG